MRFHERVQAEPAAAHLGHEGAPLGDAALGQHHVRQRVVGPGLVALHRDRASCGSLGVAHQVALFEGEGGHAVQIGDVGGGVLRQQRQPQHARRVAEVEEQVLAELERGEVPRLRDDDVRQQRDRASDVAVGPGANGLQPAALAFARGQGARRGTSQERPCVDIALGRLGKKMHRCGKGLHDDAVVVLGSREDVRHPRLAGDEAADEVVDCRRAGSVGEVDLAAKQVLHGLALAGVPAVRLAAPATAAAPRAGPRRPSRVAARPGRRSAAR